MQSKSIMEAQGLHYRDKVHPPLSGLLSLRPPFQETLFLASLAKTNANLPSFLVKNFHR